MQTHVRVLGVLFLVGAVASACLAAAYPMGLRIVGALAVQTGDPEGATGAAAIGMLGTILGIFFAVLATLWGVCGIGLLKRRSWARILAIVLSAMWVFIRFPFGTAFGIYGLWIMFNKETEAIFTKS